MKQQQKKIENKNFFYCWICQKFEVKLLIWLLILFEISTQLLKIEEEKKKSKEKATKNFKIRTHKHTKPWFLS